MLEYFFDYGLFVAKLGTLALAIVVVGGFIFAELRRGADQAGLTVQNLNRRFEDLGDTVRRAVHGKEQFKLTARQRKTESKELAKKGSQRQLIYVIDFKGDIRATATASLREEVSAVLAVASEDDRVLVRLENSGGTVHEHGLAASQLLRITQNGLRLIVSVDKIAASGGYLMACVASHIIAAPFAIVGSIGWSRNCPISIAFWKTGAWISSRSPPAGTSARSRYSARIRMKAGKSSRRRLKTFTRSSRRKSPRTGRSSTSRPSPPASIGMEPGRWNWA